MCNHQKGSIGQKLVIGLVGSHSLSDRPGGAYSSRAGRKTGLTQLCVRAKALPNRTSGPAPAQHSARPCTRSAHRSSRPGAHSVPVRAGNHGQQRCDQARATAPTRRISAGQRPPGRASAIASQAESARVRFSSPVPYETPRPEARRGVFVVQAGGQVSHHNRADRWLPSRADGLSESSIAGMWCDYWPTGRRRHRHLRHDDPKHGRGTGVGVGRLRDVDKGARIASRSVAAREARPPLFKPRKREPFLHKRAQGRASPESEKSSAQSFPRRASASTSTGVVRWFATPHKRSMRDQKSSSPIN